MENNLSMEVNWSKWRQFSVGDCDEVEPNSFVLQVSLMEESCWQAFNQLTDETITALEDLLERDPPSEARARKLLKELR